MEVAGSNAKILRVGEKSCALKNGGKSPKAKDVAGAPGGI
jgi:hypothetical protein